MKVSSQIEIALHVECFRKIDSFDLEDGQYYLRFKINLFNKQFEKYFDAVPVQITDVTTHKNQTQSNRYLINKLTNTYCTKNFILQQWSNELAIKIKEMCLFVIDLPDFIMSCQEELIIKCELMYLESKLKLHKEHQSLIPISEYTASVNLSNISEGIHEYVPIIFEGEYFNLVQTTFHANIMQFSYPKLKSDYQQNGKVILQAAYNFAQSPHQTNLTLKDLDEYYFYYIIMLRKIYDKINEFSNLIFSNCHLDNQKRDIGIFLEFRAPQQPRQKYIILKQGNHQVEHQGMLRQKSEEILINKGDNSYSNFFNQLHIEELIRSIIEEQQILEKYISNIWSNFCNFFSVGSSFLIKFLKKDYEKKAKLQFTNFIFDEIYNVKNQSKFVNYELCQQHQMQAQNYRKNVNQKFNYLCVRDPYTCMTPSNHPIIFQEIYNNTECKTMLCQHNFKKFHVFIFVHGFLGNANDHRIIKNNLSLHYPDQLYMMSSINENQTEGDIEKMGKDLAQEVTSFIQRYAPGNCLGRISFICHSLGGLIVRAALPNLNEYSDKMHTFLSFGCPHLGFKNSQHSLINIGMWFMKMWKNCQSLDQLQMNDAKQLEDCFIFQLSKLPGLSWFTNVVLVGSEQDHYVPYESSRIEKIPDKNDNLSKLHNQMVDNIFSDNQLFKRIYRLDVNFEINEKGLDTMIGRRAHILYIELQTFVRMLIYNFDMFFK